MIRLILLLFVLIFPLGAVTLGRASVFEHVGDRTKRVDRAGHHILLTGRETGLMLQCPEKPQISFPKGKSFVQAPNGQRIGLTFKKGNDKLPGYWLGEFAVEHAMIEGFYEYVVVITIDGAEHEVRHVIYYFFNEIEPSKGNVSQR